jgi:hypothetical protein
MMDKHPVPETCLSDGVLWELAFRFAGGDESGAAIASKEGPLESFPGDLFLETEDAVKDHLDRCNSCSAKLRRSILYVREYVKRTRDPDVMAIAEIITEGIVWQREGKLLRFCPYEEEDEAKRHALAARTESPHREKPLRFLSEDEELILRAFKDEKTGEDTYYLAGNDPRFVRNAIVIFMGKRYSSDADGRVDFGEAAGEIDEESEFIIILPSPDRTR